MAQLHRTQSLTGSYSARSSRSLRPAQPSTITYLLRTSHHCKGNGLQRNESKIGRLAKEMEVRSGTTSDQTSVLCSGLLRSCRARNVLLGEHRAYHTTIILLRRCYAAPGFQPSVDYKLVRGVECTGSRGWMSVVSCSTLFADSAACALNVGPESVRIVEGSMIALRSIKDKFISFVPWRKGQDFFFLTLSTHGQPYRR